MKTITPIFLLVFMLVGCKREDRFYNAKLDDSESIAAQAPIMMSGEPVGVVVATFNQGPQRCVRFAVRSGKSSALRPGTVVATVSSAGLELDSSNAVAGASELESGAFVPRRKVNSAEVLGSEVAKAAAEKVPLLGRLGLTGSNLLVGILGIAVLIWLLRASIVAGVIALIAAWLGHPFLLNIMADLLAHARANQASVAQIGSSFEAGSVAATLERSLAGTLSQLPGPTLLSIAFVFICTYLTVRFFQMAAR